MDVERLQKSPVGHLQTIEIPATTAGDPSRSYWAFVPNPLPAVPHLTMRSISDAGLAAMAIARLDQAVSQLPNPQLLLRPIIRREATSTSALEGTYAEFDEVLEADFLEDRQMSREQREIRNVVQATERAVEDIKTRPISRRLIGELQSLIVRGTDGDTYDAGDIRKRQVFIGPKNRPVEDARFVPCPPGQALEEGFSDWEKWLNYTVDVPIVIRVALAHYQFETLHPYADGNGRLGRLIALLQLIDDGALRSPVLNISTWLESRREEYMDGMLNLTCSGDMNPWIQFMSLGIREQAERGVRDISSLLRFREQLGAALRLQGLKGSALVIADNLIGYPALDVATARTMTGISFQAANSAVGRLVDFGVLTELTGRRANRLFYCQAVVDLVNGRSPGRAEQLISRLTGAAGQFGAQNVGTTETS